MGSGEGQGEQPLGFVERPANRRDIPPPTNHPSTSSRFPLPEPHCPVYRATDDPAPVVGVGDFMDPVGVAAQDT